MTVQPSATCSVAMIGLGANQPEDAIYPMSVGDADRELLDGANKYVLHFEKEELPPADAFWSITTYDAEGFVAAHKLERFAIEDRDELNCNADGPIDTYMQYDWPGKDKESNWLPSPVKSTFSVVMRLYAPKQPAIDGRWVPLAIQRVR